MYHLFNKVQDVCLLLTKSPYIHLLGLSETRLNSCVGDESLLIPNYTIFRRDAAHRGQTGMGLYVHKSITHSTKRRADLESERVECMWVEVKHSSSKATLVGYVYRNPAATYAWFDDFVHMMDKVNECNSNIVLLGDFNIDLFKSQPAWESTISLFGLHQLIRHATRITQRSATLLDHIYTNNEQMVSDVHVSDICISDHCPIICTWSCKLPKRLAKGHTTIQYRTFKHFNQDDFLRDLSSAPFANVLEVSDPSTALVAWYEAFLPVIEKHAPLRRKRVKHPTLPQWLSPDIITAMKTRNKLKKEKKFEDYKRQRNKVTNLVRAAKKAYFEKLINHNKDTSSLWRAMNEITHKSRNKSVSCEIKGSPNSFNEHFLSVSESILKSADNSFCEVYEISPLLEQFCQDRLSSTDSFTVPPIAVHEVGMYISHLKNKKSMGPDNVSSYLLKLALPYVVESLTYVYNLCIQQNTFPPALKAAKVIPLPKAKDLSDPNDFRPISLLSILTKPLERHIHRHLTQFIEDRNLFHSFQSGFRQRHSCHTALIRVCDTWLAAINQAQLTGAVFLDLKKAFDLVDHTILLQKLAIYLQNPSAVSLLKSFLHNRTQSVFLNGNYSTEGVVKCGVPQGSVLGPLLFNIFINDLPLHITNSKVVCDLFADDNSIHSCGTDVESIQCCLQESLNDVSKWCHQNRMVIHPGKTKSMVVAARQKHQLKPLMLKLTLGTDIVEQVREHRVLGVTLDEELKWQSHIDNVCKQLARNLFLLGQLKPYVSTDCRKMFFKAHILAHINYASTVWSSASEVHIKKLNSLHRRAAKLMLPDRSLSTSAKLKALEILPLREQFVYNTAVLMFKVHMGLAPQYVCDLLNRAPARYGSNKYVLPRTRVDLYKTSFAFSGSSVWNSLPPKIKMYKSVRGFKVNLRKFLFNK
ncbi:reverse transcriptase domain-containing protein [Thiolapillus sp.]|uniref:reverse transcriptase domain-containing protein n=3 Tax=Thiolapillus sp. TaxID=2017437 RepID=UPI003AF414AD